MEGFEFKGLDVPVFGVWVSVCWGNMGGLCITFSGALDLLSVNGTMRSV